MKDIKGDLKQGSKYIHVHLSIQEQFLYICAFAYYRNNKVSIPKE